MLTFLLNVSKARLLPQTKACKLHLFQFFSAGNHEISLLTSYLQSVELIPWLWVSPFIKTKFGKKIMPLQDSFQNSVFKRKSDIRIAVKRKASKIGLVIAGCCFSKKSKKDGVSKDTSEDCMSPESRLETSYGESSETQVLLSEEKRHVNILTETETGPVFEKACIVDVTEERKPVNKDVKPTSEAGNVDKVRNKIVKGKPRPNYFVAVQVDNPEIQTSLRHVQENIVEHKPLMKKALVPLSSSHITFVVMHVAEQEDLKRAEDALAASYEDVKEDLEKSPLTLTFEGLSNFKKQVLFAELKMDDGYERILTFYEKIASCFEQHGFDVRERERFTPHLTVAKLSRDLSLRRKGLKHISPAWYQDFESDVFGVQLVKSLQLLKMEKSENGYYTCAKECFFGDEPEVPLEKTLLATLEKKKEVRKKIRDLTVDKLSLHEES